MGGRKRKEGEEAPSVRVSISMSPVDKNLFSALADVDGLRLSEAILQNARLGAYVNITGRIGDAVKAPDGGVVFADKDGIAHPRVKNLLQTLETTQSLILKDVNNSETEVRINLPGDGLV